MKGGLAVDPRGLIYEAYRMEIGPEEARAIFFDWAMGLPGPVGEGEIRALLEAYAARYPAHPMTAVLSEGLARPTSRRTRGSAGRTGPSGDRP